MKPLDHDRAKVSGVARTKSAADAGRHGRL
jgi:hypothetical protein